MVALDTGEERGIGGTEGLEVGAVLGEAGGDLLFHVVAALDAPVSNLGGRRVGADVIDLTGFLWSYGEVWWRIKRKKRDAFVQIYIKKEWKNQTGSSLRPRARSMRTSSGTSRRIT